MPIARFQLPDGRIARFEVPEGTSPEEAHKQIEMHLASAPKQQESPATDAERLAGNPLMRFALGAASPFLGAAQLGAEALGDKSGTATLKQLEDMKRRGMAAEDQFQAERAAKIGAAGGFSQTPTAPLSAEQQPSSSFDVPGLAGTMFSPAVLAAMKIPAAGSVLGRAAQGAGVGAAFGAASPVTSTDDFWTAKGAQIGTGAAIGAALPPAIEGTRKFYEIARKILDPILPGGTSRSAARLLAEAAGEKRPEIERLLAENKQLVPGSQPTAAEAAAPAGNAEFSALQKIAQERQPTAYSDIAKSQEAARVGAIQEIGKTRADVQGAVEARNAAAEKNYGAVRSFLVKADEEVQKLMDRPSMEKAIARAVDLAKEQGKPFDASVGSLHYIKMALDDMVTSPERFGIGASEVRAIASTRNEFMRWLENKAPLYQKAREVYASMSKPINEMQVGQQLEKSLVKPIGEGERAGVFAQAMREAPSTIKKATGQPRYEQLDEVLSPENLAKAKGVLADLARKGEQENLARLGRAKAGEITTAFTLPAAGPLERGYVIFKTILGRISRGVTEKTLDQVAETLQVPANTLRLLQSAPTKYQQQMIDNIISQKLGRGAIAAGTQLSGEVVQQ